LGKEAEDGIDALLYQARAYEAAETPSLTGFIAWLEAQDIQLKRVLDETSNLVRVMTAHGSKGLEAPIVILPDTLKSLRETRDEFIEPDSGQVVWKGPKEQRSDVVKQSLSRLKMADLEEDRRLLYVAMTRAEKWLVVCGAGEEKEASDSWYNLVRRGLAELPTQKVDFGDFEVDRYAYGDWPTPQTGEVRAKQMPPILPDWCHFPAPEPDLATAVLSPSDLGGAKALPGEANVLDQEAAMRRGSQLHRLIEILPGVAPDRRAQVARHVLTTGEDAALDDEVGDLLEEALGVLNASYDWDVFGANSLAEVPYTSQLSTKGGQVIHGIIDRLIITPNRVQIIDYKSNAVIPEQSEDIPEGLLRQLGAYAEAMALIYPDREIETAILWTRTAQLAVVPLDIVMSALRRTATS
jgi:ATP-dependent helicase/nuclease subunit A